MSSEPVWKGSYNSGTAYGQTRLITIPTDPGDRLVIVDATGATTKSVFTPTGGGLTWTYITGVTAVASHSQTDILISSPSAGGNLDITVPTNNNSTTVPWAFSIMRFGNVSGWGPSDSRVDVNGINVLTLNAASPPRSAVVWVTAGWNGVNWTTRTFDTTAGPAYEQMYSTIAGRLTISTGVILPAQRQGATNVGVYGNGAGEVYSQSAFELYGTMTPVESSVSTTWDQLPKVTVTGSQSATYAVRQRIVDQSDGAPVWAVRARVTQSLANSYDVRARVTAALATTYDVRSILVDPQATTWGVRVPLVGPSVSDAFAVRGAVPAQGTGDTFDVRQLVSGAQGGQAYDVRARVTAGLSTTWAVAAAPVTQLTTTYGVRVGVSDSHGDTYGVRVPVTGRPNRVVDPSFENSSVWTPRLTAGYSLDSTVFRSGTQSLRSAARGDMNGVSVQIPAVPVQPGEVWRVAGYRLTDVAYNGTGDNGKLRLANQTGALIAAIAWDNGQTWAERSMTYTVPSDGSVTALSVSVVSNHTAGVLWVDDLTIENMSVPAVDDNVGDSYGVRGIAETSVDDTWGVTFYPSQTTSDSFDVRSIVERAQATDSPVRARVTQSLATTYPVRARIIDSSDTSTYAVRQRVTQTATQTSPVRSIVTASSGDTWYARSIVEQTKSDEYGYRSSANLRSDSTDVFADRAIVTASSSAVSPVRSVVSTSVATAWYARQRIVNTCQESYPVRALIVDPQATAWRVTQAVEISADELYRVALAVAQSSFDEFFELQIVSSTDQDRYGVRVPIVKQQATTWYARQRVTTSSVQTYAQRQRVTSTAQSTNYGVRLRIIDSADVAVWMTKARIVDTHSTTWGVRQLSPVWTASDAYDIVRRRRVVTASADIARTVVRVARDATRGAVVATLGRRRVRAVINGDGE